MRYEEEDALKNNSQAVLRHEGAVVGLKKSRIIIKGKMSQEKEGGVLEKIDEAIIHHEGIIAGLKESRKIIIAGRHKLVLNKPEVVVKKDKRKYIIVQLIAFNGPQTIANIAKSLKTSSVYQAEQLIEKCDWFERENLLVHLTPTGYAVARGELKEEESVG